MVVMVLDSIDVNSETKRNVCTVGISWQSQNGGLGPLCIILTDKRHSVISFSVGKNNYFSSLDRHKSYLLIVIKLTENVNNSQSSPLEIIRKKCDIFSQGVQHFFLIVSIVIIWKHLPTKSLQTFY